VHPITTATLPNSHRNRLDSPARHLSTHPPLHGEQHEQGHGFKEERKEETGQDHEGKEGRQTGKEKEQVSGCSVALTNRQQPLFPPERREESTTPQAAVRIPAMIRNAPQ
jgi:hypothetical protein